MSLITPSGRKGATKGGGGRRNENNRIYAYPLPILFSPPEQKSIKSVLGQLGLSTAEVVNPHCEGFFDEATRSIWVPNGKDALLLWRRGFFGKGDLSRSEPSWLARQINAKRSAGKHLTSEEIREKRRAERKQFKLDRAQAMAAAAAEAEAAFAEGRVISPLVGPDGTRVIPSAATWKPAPSQNELPSTPVQDDEELDVELEREIEQMKDVEHLRLTLPEAFFLQWNLDCLTVLDPHTNEPLNLLQIWRSFQAAHLPPTLPPTSLHDAVPHRFDNPFLINYMVYHHYRSLGWVVKGGIKFCVDYLLYKRGPVFHHAEFAIVVCPVYEDPADRDTSPFDLMNSEPFEWSWLSTINRVNSQVQKTLILTYVTIPAMSRVSTDLLGSPACFSHYSVREVTVRRFIPARMRD
ncbi:hypothetical protein PLICRDRAFT_700626 [Plicaturopsis crispa FD-325 SS-3]|nr:hypothetical protein PLICRDRAFT_700626 [Plicaturopsis crispa FD-325 SS-3]